MVSNKLIVVLLVVAVLLSVFSIVMTLSLSTSSGLQMPEGTNHGEVAVEVAFNPLAGPGLSEDSSNDSEDVGGNE